MLLQQWVGLAAVLLGVSANPDHASPNTTIGAVMPAPHTLLAEYRPSPVIGLGVSRPRFSWTLPAMHDVVSTAYQIRITDTTGNITWDSGKADGGDCNQVASGVDLKADTRSILVTAHKCGRPTVAITYSWSVRFWAAEELSAFSEAAVLHTGLFDKADWQGATMIKTQTPTTAAPTTAAPTALGSCTTPNDCEMIELEQVLGKAGYFQGVYNESQALHVTDIPGCIYACSEDPDCVQATWAPHNSSGHPKCVKYQSLASDFTGASSATDARGWAKISGRFIRSDGEHCPVVGYPRNCIWFESFKDRKRHFVAESLADCYSFLDVTVLPADQLAAMAPGSNFSCNMSIFRPQPPPSQSALSNPAELMRLEFEITEDFESVVAYVSAVGWVQAYLNGYETTPNDRLNPGRTSFNVRQYYLAQDVTSLVKNGQNVVAMLLGHGWQSVGGGSVLPTEKHTPAARLLLSIKLNSGAKYYVASSALGFGWLGSRDGPIRGNDIYQGEVYDARKELNAWTTTDFDVDADPSWHPVIEKNEFKHAQITWQPMPPIRALELNAPVSITPVHLSTQTVWVFKFAQNAAGWSKLTVDNCTRGTEIQMYFSEVLCGYGPTKWSAPCTVGQLPGEGKAGTVDQRNLHGLWHNVYICKGQGTEVYEPTFMYTGHRYVEVHGFPGTPTSKSLQQRVVHSDMEAAFGSSADLPRRLSGAIAFGLPENAVAPAAPAIDGDNCYEGETCTAQYIPTGTEAAVLDQISHNVRWTLVDNLHSVPEDCDQRNERWGWMADASVSAEGNYYYHDIASLYTSWLTEMRDVQTAPDAVCAKAVGSGGDTNVGPDGQPNCTGAVGDLTPGKTPAELPGDPSWMFAYPLVFSYQHRYMADSRLASALYPGIREYALFLKTMADRGTGKTAGLLTWKKYGDWLQPGRVQSLDEIGEMSSGFNFGQTLRIARDTATVLGYSADAEMFDDAYKTLQKAFHEAWWDIANSTYGNGQQSALVYALYLGAVPEHSVNRVFEQLLSLINRVDQPPDHTTAHTQQCATPPCIDTGILATKWLMELLSLHGRTDVGLDLAFQTDYPSWGYMAAMNSTTVWEHWEYMNGPGMNSHNHPALASIGAWLYRWVAGLRLDDGTVHTPDYSKYGAGFKHVLFAPGCVTDLRLPSAAARITTLYGPVEVGWQNTNGSLAMRISLPANTHGRVAFPSVAKPASTTVQCASAGKFEVVWEAGAFVGGSVGVNNGSVVDGLVVLNIGSGNYSFLASL